MSLQLLDTILSIVFPLAALAVATAIGLLGRELWRIWSHLAAAERHTARLATIMQSAPTAAVASASESPRSPRAPRATHAPSQAATNNQPKGLTTWPLNLILK